MKIYIIQHIDFEAGGGIFDWAQRHGNKVITVHPDEGELLPEPEQTDLVVLLGGTFDIEDLSLDWLNKEKAWLQKLISAKQKILAICGGAQLLTTLLGGRVFTNQEPEIGWFEIELTEFARKEIFSELVNANPLALHWHRDAFTLPPGATLLASSKATEVQGYQLGSHILAVQFHPEVSAHDVQQLVDACGAGVDPTGRFQQDASKILIFSGQAHRDTAALLYALLDYLSL